jgi:hypothetical protein
MLVGLIAGAALGGAAHVVAPAAAWLDAVIRYGTDPIGRIFLRLLFMLVIPLIVTALSLGVDRFLDMCRTTINVTATSPPRWWWRTRSATRRQRPSESPRSGRRPFSAPRTAGAPSSRAALPVRAHRA